ncbi:MAG: DUF1343 domain-containing protein [Acidobacteria bacterium]|nr:DUF1343 domain-containing protein [Acidobacteriota bacterium]
MKQVAFSWLAAGALALAQGDFRAGKDLDNAIEDAIAKKQIPGAVVLVGQGGRTLHHKAYGKRSLEGAGEAMTLDTVFDAASLTKVVATTSGIMRLVEQGKLRLTDRVTEYIPEFQGGKSEITVRHLLTHVSGFRPDVDLEPVWAGHDTGLRLAITDKPVAAPGARFIYSDINFLVLGMLIERLSGGPMETFLAGEVFKPLGMSETLFKPPATLRRRIAPTERLKGEEASLRGVVHDPTARYMGGVAGHAGMFTTAADLARFARMMLGQGMLDGKRHFAAATVAKFTSVQSPDDHAVKRGLGWDIDSPFSSPRGELYPVGSYGHTGFTGTSMWMDPGSRSFVILMSNSVHPMRRPAISSLRARVATAVAAAVGSGESAASGTPSAGTPGAGIPGTGINEVARPLISARNGQVLTGIDVLAEQKFSALAGKRVGLITNHTGLTRDGKRNIDVMAAGGVKLTALLTPEHGITGREDHEEVPNSKDEATGIPIWSLYLGETRRPNEAVLKTVDVLVFDIQDIGARFYTYLSTLVNVMQEAAKVRMPVYVLDRPNPINGVAVEGPVLEENYGSFVGIHPLALRHGMTIAELARMVNEEKKIGADLRVVEMRNWQRSDWFDSTSLIWVDPSPNMRSLPAALLYPGVAMLEYSRNYSVGRGTGTPFEQVGAEWIVGADLASYLNRRFIPGVRFYPVRFEPSAMPLQGKKLEGVRIVITNRDAVNSTRVGMEIGVALEKLYPGKLPFEVSAKLIANRAVIEGFKAAREPLEMAAAGEAELDRFRARRAKYLIYRPPQP